MSTGTYEQRDSNPFRMFEPDDFIEKLSKQRKHSFQSNWLIFCVRA